MHEHKATDWRLMVALAVILFTLGSLVGLVAEGNLMLERVLAYAHESRRMALASAQREMAATTSAAAKPETKEARSDG